MRKKLEINKGSETHPKNKGITYRVWSARSLMWALAKRDIRARFMGSVGGVTWNVLQPLVLIAVFTLLFNYVLGMKNFTGGKGYIFYLVAGLLPWNALQEAFMRSTNVFIENSRLILKTPFPIEVLVGEVIIASILNLSVGLTVFIIFLPLLGVPYHLFIFLLPIALLLEAFLITGPSLILASLTPFWRDIHPITSLVLLIGFWATPIVYKPEMLPPQTAIMLKLNAFHHLANFFRASLSGEDFPSLDEMAILILVSLAMSIAGVWIFSRTRKKIPELL